MRIICTDKCERTRLIFRYSNHVLVLIMLSGYGYFLCWHLSSWGSFEIFPWNSCEILNVKWWLDQDLTPFYSSTFRKPCLRNVVNIQLASLITLLIIVWKYLNISVTQTPYLNTTEADLTPFEYKTDLS